MLTRRLFLRITKVIAIVLTVLLLACIVGCSMLETMLEKRLPEWTSSASNGIYRLETGKVSLNIFTRSVCVKEIRLSIDYQRISKLRAMNQLSQYVYEAETEEIAVSGVDLFRLIGRNIYCNNIRIVNPIIHRISVAEKQEPEEKKTGKTDKLRIMIETVEIIQPYLAEKTPGNPVPQILIASKEKMTVNDIFYSAENNGTIKFGVGAVDIRNLVYYKAGGFYTYSCNSFRTDIDCMNIDITGLNITPVYDHQIFYQKMGHQKDIYNVFFSGISLKDVNRNMLFDSLSLYAESGNVTGLNLDIFASRLPPPNPADKRWKYPQLLLKKVPFPVYVGKLDVIEARIKYTELSRKTQREGSLLFNHVNGTITNITNRPALIAADKHCTADLKAKLLGKSDLKTKFDFILDDSLAAYTLKGNLTNLTSDQVNQPAKALALAELSSFRLKKMDFSITGNELAASGDFVITYSDLKIEVKKQENKGDADLKDRPLLTAAAGALIYEANPMPGEQVRKVNVQIERDPKKSFFNLIWKVVGQAGAKTAIKTKIPDSMQGKPQKKKKRFLIF